MHLPGEYFMKSIAILILLASLTVPATVSAQEFVQAEFQINSPDQLKAFYELKINITSRVDDAIYADATPAQLDALESFGFHPISTHTMTPQVQRGEFHTPEEMESILNDLADANPDLMTIEVIGQSVSGRNMLLVKLSDNPELDEAEPGVLFDGAIHGNENISTEVILYFINYCLENYGTDSEVTQLLDDHELFFVPMVNPDGVHNVRRYNDNNCDCNRDHPFFWEQGWTGKPTYASQPETQTMVNLALGKNFVSSLSYHSGAVYFNYPWDTFPSDTHPSPDNDHFLTLADGYSVRAEDMPITEGYDWYQIHGSGEESYYGSNGTLASIIELTYYQQPMPENMIDTLAERNLGAMLWFAQQSRQGIHGLILDAVNGEAVSGIILTDDENWPVYSTAPVGDYWRYLLPGAHTLTVVAPGYVDLESDEITLARDSDSITSDFQLEPDDVFTGFAYKVPAVNMADPHDDHNNYSLPYMALGMPDDVPFHMGVGGFIVLMTTDRAPIANGDGYDFTIHEAGGAGESYEVFASDSWLGPWISFGAASGTASFNLDSVGKTHIQYIKIVDDGDGAEDAADAGFDLDAMTYSLQCGLPGPEFTAHPTEGAAPLDVQFIPQYTGIPGCTREIQWEFGDEEISDAGRPAHTYTEPGTYTVRLAATGPGGSETFSRADYIVVTAGDDDADDDIDDDTDDDDSSNDDVNDDLNDDANDDTDTIYSDNDFADDDDDDDSSGGCGC